MSDIDNSISTAMTYCCFICKAKYFTKERCKQHMLIHKTKSIHSGVNSTIKVAQGDYQMQNYFNEVSEENIDVLKHEVKYEPIDCVEKDLEAAIKDVKIEPIECVEELVASNQVLVPPTESLYNEEKTYMCKECGHYLIMPTGLEETPDKCIQCDKGNTSKEYLLAHTKLNFKSNPYIPSKYKSNWSSYILKYDHRCQPRPKLNKKVSKWLLDFSWLSFESGLVYCKVCIEFKHLIRTSDNKWTLGNNDFSKSRLVQHDQSVDHLKCVSAKKQEIGSHQEKDIHLKKMKCWRSYLAVKKIVS